MSVRSSPLAVRLVFRRPPPLRFAKRGAPGAQYAIDTNAIIRRVPRRGRDDGVHRTTHRCRPDAPNPTATIPRRPGSSPRRAIPAASSSRCTPPRTCPGPRERHRGVLEQVGVKARIQYIDYAAWSRINNTHQSGPATIMQFSTPSQDHCTRAGCRGEKPYVVELPQPRRREAAARGWRPPPTPRDATHLQGNRPASCTRTALGAHLYRALPCGEEEGLLWEPQVGIAWFNLRDMRWK